MWLRKDVTALCASGVTCAPVVWVSRVLDHTTIQDPKDKLELKENVDSGVYVKDLTTFVVKSAMEIDHVMQVSER